MSEICPWCKYSPGCPEQEGSGSCDFKELPFEKQAIIERVKRESENIKVMLGKAAKAGDADFNKVMSDCGDVFAGVKIMMNVLHSEFGVDRDEMQNIFKSSSSGELHFLEKMALVRRLHEMKRSRRQK
jgi:hypothetical protein